MTSYAMVIKNASPGANVVFKTKASNLEEAINYFSKIKQLPKKEFLKLFLVVKSET